LKLTKEAFEDIAGVSPGEMLAMIAQRQYAQSTSAGDAMAIKAITEANKYIEPTQDAKAASEDKVEDMSEEDLLERILELTDQALDEKKH
jgi:NAD(P)H-dependent FMN reductase